MDKEVESNQKQEEPILGANEHFGTCPICNKTNGFFNVGRDHWFYCDEHQMRWCTGSNHFRCWREESSEIWEENKLQFGHYRDVSP